MTIISHSGYFYNYKRCRISNHCKGGTMEKKRTKKKVRKKSSRKRRRKIKFKHNSHNKAVNLQEVMSLKFPPFKEAYKNFWEKRKKEKEKQEKLKNKNREKQIQQEQKQLKDEERQLKKCKNSSEKINI